ncbi:MAG TPA: hypothetical protein VKZ53_11075 [Candidatus Angelobacter sp.]|nr:hypothetical protein [Candidatus Angelobacter sp.]
METKLGDLMRPQTIVGAVDLEVTEGSFDSPENSKTLLKGVSRSEFGEIRESLLGKKATISIASPDPNSIRLSVDGDRERVLVPLICTFDPDPAAHFNYARVEGQLVTGAHSEKAVAEEIFPKEINSTVQISSDLKLSPKFTFKEVEFEPVVLEKKKDYILFEPEIIALHVGTQKPAWSLRSTDSKNVIGTKYLYLIVNKPAGTAAFLEINVGGRIQTTLGPIPIAWAKKDRVTNLVIKI